ncbi:MAG: hypothetical protein Kow0056_10550 [Coriobacteriia bacterium]
MLERLKPGVAKRWLYLIAGVIWTAVGCMLLVLAVSWVKREALAAAAGILAVGIALGAAGGATMFAGIARKNIARIREAPDIACAFSFQAWRGYLIMAFMIALGVVLRHSAIPKPALALTYAAVGTALAYSSFLYYRALPS